VELSRQTLANWMIQGSKRWLEYLYERMHKYLLSESVLYADDYRNVCIIETGLQIAV